MHTIPPKNPIIKPMIVLNMYITPNVSIFSPHKKILHPVDKYNYNLQNEEFQLNFKVFLKKIAQSFLVYIGLLSKHIL